MKGHLSSIDGVATAQSIACKAISSDLEPVTNNQTFVGMMLMSHLLSIPISNRFQRLGQQHQHSFVHSSRWKESWRDISPAAIVTVLLPALQSGALVSHS
jgi:hypothetical protein